MIRSGWWIVLDSYVKVRGGYGNNDRIGVVCGFDETGCKISFEDANKHETIEFVNYDMIQPVESKKQDKCVIIFGDLLKEKGVVDDITDKEKALIRLQRTGRLHVEYLKNICKLV
uniref:Phage protein n=1 Tax=Strongyloides papillosus TaxID=174720 RepID=A0A0N5CDV5_STREA